VTRCKALLRYSGSVPQPPEPTRPAPSKQSQLLQLAFTLSAALSAALLCVWLSTPLPWMIGPLLAVAALTLAGARTTAPLVLRNAGQWAIGTSLGLYFTPPVMAIVLKQSLWMGLGIVWALLLGFAFAWWLKRSNALDASTAFFAGAIGGASEMANQAEAHGGRVDLVAAAHSMRILLVVITLPFGFQWLGLQGLDAALPGTQQVVWPGLVALAAVTCLAAALARRFASPNAWVIGPLIVTIVLTASGVQWSALPQWAINAGQLFIGVTLGARFTPAFVHTAPRFLATVSAGTLVAIALSLGVAWLLSLGSGIHPATLALGTSPGGIAEMCITAKVLQLGVPTVTAFHVTRMAAVVLLAGPLYRLLGKT
jgi:membrane AbrB-like protein